MPFLVPLGPETLRSGAPTLPIPLGADNWLLVSSGGVHRTADAASVQRRAEVWAAHSPATPIYAFTSGIANVERLATAVRSPVLGIFYDYEPNYPNEPEFTFDTEITSRNLQRATALCRAHGLRSVGYLTGQALLNPDHTWNYARFRSDTDELCVQTQASVRRGRLSEALDRLSEQFGTAPPIVQITVAPGLPNAVDVPTALAARAEMERRGFDRVVLWWIPGGDRELVALTSGRGGGPLAA